MFYNTKDTVLRILKTHGGLPEECEWIDYKRSHKLDRGGKDKLGCEVTAFLNCIGTLGQGKYILFGIRETKKEHTKELTGLEGIPFPDDNEWQNVFSHIKPAHPTVETGVVHYQGLEFGYFYIAPDNYRGPYGYPINGKDKYCIRKGSSRFDMTPQDHASFQKKAEEITRKGTAFSKTRESVVLTVVGQYVEENPYDQDLLASYAYEDHETFQQRCTWQNVPIHREQSKFLSIPATAARIGEKHARLAQFSPDEADLAMEIIRYALEHRENIYSPELLEGVLDTLAFLSEHGFSCFAQETIRAVVTIELVCNARYGAQIAYIAETDPEFILALLRSNKEAFKRCKETFIRALQAIAWLPEYYKDAVRLLREFGGRRAGPALYRLFRIEPAATAARFSQKLELIREIAAQDQGQAFDILYKALGFGHAVYESGPIPQKYLRLSEWPQNASLAKLQTYYGELLDLIGDDADRVLALLPQQLPPYPYSNLHWLADYIERMEPKLKDPAGREKLWVRLCKTPLEYGPGVPLESGLRDKLAAIGQKFRPNDPYEDYRLWFRDNSCLQLRIEDFDPGIIQSQLAKQQKCALLDLYRQGGIGEVISFLSTVPDRQIRLPRFAAELGEVFTLEDDKALLDAFFDAPDKYGYYFSAKFHSKGQQWISNLGIAALTSDQRAEFFCALVPNKEDLLFFNAQMGEDAKLYWSIVNPTRLWNCIEPAFDAFEQYGFLSKAFDLLSQDFGRLEDVSPQWLFRRLMLLKDHDDINMPGYGFANVYRSLSHRLEAPKLEELEKLSFEKYGDRLFANGIQELRPNVTFWRIANEPEFLLEWIKQIDGPFCSARNLLNQCDSAPENIQDWLERIDTLCALEPENIRRRAEGWVGFLLYNHLEDNQEAGYTLDPAVADALEHSEEKRKGFFRHAYFSSSGCHANGRFEYDAKDRENAKYFTELAEQQKARGNWNMADALYAYARYLIEGVESV